MGLQECRNGKQARLALGGFEGPGILLRNKQISPDQSGHSKSHRKTEQCNHKNGYCVTPKGRFFDERTDNRNAQNHHTNINAVAHVGGSEVKAWFDSKILAAHFAPVMKISHFLESIPVFVLEIIALLTSGTFSPEDAFDHIQCLGSLHGAKIGKCGLLLCKGCYISWGISRRKNCFPVWGSRRGADYRIITPILSRTGTCTRFFSLIASGTKTYFLSYILPS